MSRLRRRYTQPKINLVSSGFRALPPDEPAPVQVVLVPPRFALFAAMLRGFHRTGKTLGQALRAG